MCKTRYARAVESCPSAFTRFYSDRRRRVTEFAHERCNSATFLLPCPTNSLSVGSNPGCQSTDRDDCSDNGKRQRNGHIEPARGQHLEGDESQKHTQTVVQVAKAIEQCRQREVE